MLIYFLMRIETEEKVKKRNSWFLRLIVALLLSLFTICINILVFVFVCFWSSGRKHFRRVETERNVYIIFNIRVSLIQILFSFEGI